MLRCVVAVSILLLCPAVLCEDTASSEQQESTTVAQEEQDDTSLWLFVDCFSEDVVSKCIADRTARALRKILYISENTSLSKIASEDYNNLEVTSPGPTSFTKVIVQIIGEGLTRLLPLLEEDDDDGDEDENSSDVSQHDSDVKPQNKSGLQVESRKKKKKKLLMKLHNLIQKLFMLKLLLKSKVIMIILKLSLLVQLKLVLLVLANLLVNVYRLYIEKTRPHEPQKVVYYEHAQHQHHYDQEHFHHDDKGWLGSLWSRSSEDWSGGDQAYSAHRPVHTDSPHIQHPYLSPKPLLG